MMTKTVSELDQLLTHARWVEGFARALVRDDADDVAQDAWIAAIQKPPAPAASPRPWLATVMRNAARMRFRGAKRRQAREDGVESPSVPTPDELAQRMELQRRLASAVLALEEPQRSTIVLVFYEGLSPAEVARRLDIPATNVRSRLRAALEILRAHLDKEEGGDRSRWKLALAPLVATVPAPTGPLLALGLAAAAVTATTAIVVLALPSNPTPIVHAPATVTSTPPSTTVPTTPVLATPVIDATDQAPQEPPPPTVTPAFLRARDTLIAHFDECYELARKSGRDVRGLVEMTVELATRPQVSADVAIEKGTTITDADTLECLRENTTAIEEHLERLREQGERIEGPIRVRISRAMPPPPKEKEDWPADTDSPPCPAGTHIAGTLRKAQWCEQPDGTKHGPTYTWDEKGRLVLIGSYEDGKPTNGIRMRDPESE